MKKKQLKDIEKAYRKVGRPVCFSLRKMLTLYTTALCEKIQGTAPEDPVDALPLLKGLFIAEYERDVNTQHSMLNGVRSQLIALLPPMDYLSKESKRNKASPSPPNFLFSPSKVMMSPREDTQLEG